MKNEITFEQFQASAEIVKAYQKQLELNLVLINGLMHSTPNAFGLSKGDRLQTLDCSARLYNQLREHGKNCGVELNQWSLISELYNFSLSKFKQCRGVGKKTIDELEEICHSLNIELKP